MKEILTYIAQSLVDAPDQVEVTAKEFDEEVVLSLKVAPEDLGRVIGRQGRVAKAIRTVMKAAGTRAGKKRVTVDILD